MRYYSGCRKAEITPVPNLGDIPDPGNAGVGKCFHLIFPNTYCFINHSKHLDMRIYSIHFLATAIAVLFQFSIFAQHSVSGIVVNENKTPLIGATVYIKGTYTGATTKINGEFTIKNIPNSEITIVASYLGYLTVEQTISGKTDITNLKFILTVDAVSMSKDVVVMANRVDKKTPVAFQDLDSTYIAENNIGVDLPIVLQNATSVVSTSDAGNGVGYSGIRIRGSDATRINVTLNGIPFNDPESQGTFFVNLPDITSSANDIQIQRGVGTSTNGAGAFGASININTLELEKEAYGRYSFGYGSFNTMRNSISFGTGLTKNNFAFDGRLSTIKSNGYIDRATSDLKSYYLKAGYYGKKFSAKFVTFGGNNKTYQAWYGVPKDSLENTRTFNPYNYDNQVDNYSQTHYQTHLNYVINSRWKTSLSGFLILGNGYYEEYKGDKYNQLTYGAKPQKLADYGLDNVIIGNDTITKTNLIRRRWLDNNFGGMVFNLTYQKDAINAVFGGGYNQYEGKHFGEIIWAEYASNGQINHRYYDNIGKKMDLNFYGKGNWQATEKLNVFLDLQFRQIRYEVSGVDNDQRVLLVDDTLTFFNPKLGASYEFNNQSSSYFSVALANHEPNRGDYIDAPQGVTPTHESLLDFEAGYRYANTKLLANANLYYMSYQNQLVLTGAINDVGGSIRQNVGSSYRAGVEIELGYKLTPKLTWSVNATFSQNKIASYTQYVDDWYNTGQSQYELTNTDIAFSPSVIAGSNITYKSPIFSTTDEFSASLISKYVGEQYFDNTQNQNRKLDAYFTNDIRLGYTLTNIGINKLNFNFTVRNILNSLYISNAWSYTFEYNDGGTSGWSPTDDDVYTHKVGDNGTYQQVGYFPQAGINWMMGFTFDF